MKKQTRTLNMDNTTQTLAQNTTHKNELHISNIIMRVTGWGLWLPAMELLDQNLLKARKVNKDQKIKLKRRRDEEIKRRKGCMHESIIDMIFSSIKNNTLQKACQRGQNLFFTVKHGKDKEWYKFTCNYRISHI